MSVNGKQDEGNVYLDIDGYMLCYLKNASGCWYKLYLSPEKRGGNMWLSDSSPSIYPNNDYKFVMNIKELLTTIRKELTDESSS